MGKARQDAGPIFFRLVLLQRAFAALALAMMISPAARYLLAAQSVVMLLAARRWWDVWVCPCNLSFQNAALWTGLTMSQGVIVIALLALRSS